MYEITKAINKYYDEVSGLDIESSDLGWLIRDFQEHLLERTKDATKEAPTEIRIDTPTVTPNNYEELGKALKKAFDAPGFSKN